MKDAQGKEYAFLCDSHFVILLDVAFEEVRDRCFDFLTWRVCLAGNSSSLAGVVSSLM
jgi:hypothetical protein